MTLLNSHRLRFTNADKAGRRSVSARRSAFTLLELMVVIGIIILVASLAVPAVGPMLKSNQRAQAINTLNGMLTVAQTAAQANALNAALRFERAFEVDEDGQMVDRQGNRVAESGGEPAWLPYQQVKYVLYAFNRSSSNTFEVMQDTSSVALPKSVWIAPGYSIDMSLADADLYSPYSTVPISYNRLNTFYVVFDQSGGVARLDSGTIAYVDETLMDDSKSPAMPPTEPHPDESARSLLVYDREKFDAIGDDADRRFEFLTTEAQPVYINRFMASIVETAGE